VEPGFESRQQEGIYLFSGTGAHIASPEVKRSGRKADTSPVLNVEIKMRAAVLHTAFLCHRGWLRIRAVPVQVADTCCAGTSC